MANPYEINNYTSLLAQIQDVADIFVGRGSYTDDQRNHLFLKLMAIKTYVMEEVADPDKDQLKAIMEFINGFKDHTHDHAYKSHKSDKIIGRTSVPN